MTTIIGNKLPYAHTLARRAMSDPSAITPADRLKFRRLSPAEQAKEIGTVAKLQLNQVNKLISQHISGKTKPTAVYLWFRVLANSYEKPGENIKTDKKSDYLMIKTINKLYPQLADVSSEITRLFTGSFKYWVDNFYSCGGDGERSFSACKNSAARDLSSDDMQMINDKSDMNLLGQHIKKYADDLLLKNFPESYKI